jgi:hypothetical protein
LTCAFVCVCFPLQHAAGSNHERCQLVVVLATVARAHCRAGELGAGVQVQSSLCRGG